MKRIARLLLCIALVYFPLAVHATPLQTRLNLHKKAQAGEAEAQALLGLHLRGKAVAPFQKQRALKWIQAAEKQNHPYGQFLLCQEYVIGQLVPENKQKAQSLCKKAASALQKRAQSGTPVAGYMLAQMYKNGLGVPQSDMKMAQWALTFTRQGIMIPSGLLLLKSSPKENMNRIDMLKKQVLRGDGQDMMVLAYEYQTQDRLSEALYWLYQAAKAGKTEAYPLIGDAHAKGEGTPVDREEAMAWYLKIPVNHPDILTSIDQVINFYGQGVGKPELFFTLFNILRNTQSTSAYANKLWVATAKRGFLPGLKTLLNQKNIRTELRFVPAMEVALTRSHWNVAQTLWHAGTFSAKDKHKLILTAVSDNPDALHWLHKQKVNLLQPDSEGYSPWVHAAGYNNKALTILAEKGMTLENQKKPGHTALHQAIRKGQWQHIPLLLTAGESWQTENTKGETAVFMAIRTQRPEIFQPDFLRSEHLKGLDFQHRNHQGETLMHVALKQRSYITARALLNHPINWEIKDKSGISARILLEQASQEWFGKPLPGIEKKYLESLFILLEQIKTERRQLMSNAWKLQEQLETYQVDHDLYPDRLEHLREVAQLSKNPFWIPLKNPLQPQKSQPLGTRVFSPDISHRGMLVYFPLTETGAPNSTLSTHKTQEPKVAYLLRIVDHQGNWLKQNGKIFQLTSISY